MNLSGGPVSALVKYFGVEVDQVLVLHDELDIPFGQLRLKKGGGEGGHNGLRSVSQSLATKDYCRLRLGVGRPPGRMDAADFVLRDFASAERADAALMVEPRASRWCWTWSGWGGNGPSSRSTPVRAPEWPSVAAPPASLCVCVPDRSRTVR